MGENESENRWAINMGDTFPIGVLPTSGKVTEKSSTSDSLGELGKRSWVQKPPYFEKIHEWAVPRCKDDTKTQDRSEIDWSLHSPSSSFKLSELSLLEPLPLNFSAAV
jgi:hypothetical protein